jgi:serine/threonine protein kinase
VNDQSHPAVLQPGYELHWYRIESVLGKGAFGITYLAHDINLDRQVAIKEYLPSQFAVRNDDLTVSPATEGHKEDFEWGLKRFISEAKILTKFEHSNLVRVFNVFEMNNSAYMVMNYEVGKSLQQLLKSKIKLTESELMKIVIPLLSGMEVMHAKGFVHRDIKPGNIFIRTDGSPVLLDFGSARQTRGERGQEMSEEAQTVTTLVSPGYAPIEQYGSSGNRQGPWTDIYGLGATIYKAITGKMPASAIDRSEVIVHDMKDCYLPVSNLNNGRYTNQFLAAIDHALAFKADDRPQNVVEWRSEFGITEDDIPTMTVSGSLSTSDEATVKLVQEETVTLKIVSDSEEKTEKVESVAGTKVSKSKWVTGVFIISASIIFGLIIFSGKKEVYLDNENKTSPVVQALSKPEQPVVEDMVEPEEERVLFTTDEQARIKELLLRAEEDISKLRLTKPNENNALNKYLSVLMIDENNIEANEGVRFISDKYVSLAYGAMQSNELAKADAYIDKAKSIYPESDKISPAISALQAKREQQKNMGDQQTAEKSSSETQKAVDSEEKESGGLWDKIKKWDEENQTIEKEESAMDKTIKKHF